MHTYHYSNVTKHVKVQVCFFFVFYVILFVLGQFHVNVMDIFLGFSVLDVLFIAKYFDI